MKHKTTIALFKILLGFFVLVMPVNDVFCQTIDAVSFPGTGPLGICASASSRFSVNFTINETSGAFPPGTTFSVEFSNVSPYNTAQFTSISNSLPTSTGTNTRSISFELPSNFVGAENYKIRIVSSSNVTSNWYPSGNIFYYAYFRPYILNSFSIFGGETQANICSGGNITLAVDPATSTTTSPLTFTNLKYIWETSTTSTGTYSLVNPIQTGPACTISAAGFYRAKIDYGTCTKVIANSPTSQIVNVTQSGTGTTFTIASTLSNPICSGTPTILSVPAGYSYKWFKNNSEILGATMNSYTTDQPGSYYVKVTAGGCGESNSVPYEVKVAPISAEINKLVAPQINFVLLGESLLVTASAQGASPTYQWSFEGTNVVGEINSTFTATAPGNYSVKITATNASAACATTEEIKFILKNGIPSVNIPNVISPNNDGINDTWIIPQKYLSGSKTEIQILTAQGKVEFTTTDYKNDWPTSSIDFKNTNPIYYYIITTANQETKMGSITVIK